MTTYRRGCSATREGISKVGETTMGSLKPVRRSTTSAADLALDFGHSLRLLDEFRDVPVFEWIVEATGYVGLDPEGLVNFLDLGKRLRYLAKEQHPVSTGFVLGVDEELVGRLEQAALTFIDPLRLSPANADELASVAVLVDGLREVILVDRSGTARGVCRLHQVGPTDPVPLCAPAYRSHCSLCKRAKALAFVFLGEGVINVFWEHGQMLRYDARGWRFRNSQEMEQLLSELASVRQIEREVLRTLFCLALEMSDRHRGAILMVGDEGKVLANSDPSRLPPFLRIDDLSLLGGRLDELEKYAEQDGAVVLDATGRVVRVMTHLRPARGSAMAVRCGVGLRHTSAAGMTAVTDAVAIVVSQDGPISVYVGGDAVLEI